MPVRSAQEVLTSVDMHLRAARFGLEDMARPKRLVPNAIVFGRTVTLALQNLKSVDPAFEAWYAIKQHEMKASALMKHFVELRNKIEKEAHAPGGSYAHVKSWSSSDFELLEPRPPGATDFFMGDENGGSGWCVPMPDGSVAKYYVALPTDKVVSGLILDGPPAVSGRLAAEVVGEYLDYLEGLVEEAKAKFL